MSSSDAGRGGKGKEEGKRKTGDQKERGKRMSDMISLIAKIISVDNHSERRIQLRSTVYTVVE